MYETKRRRLPGKVGAVRYGSRGAPDPRDPLPYTSVIVPPYQETWGWVNPEPGSEEELLELSQVPTRNGFTTSSSDTGHEFWTTKTSMWLSHPDSYFQPYLNGSESLPYWIRGPLAPNPVMFPIDPSSGSRALRDPYPALPQNLDRVAKGTFAIKVTAPTAPKAQLATLVGEGLTSSLLEYPAVSLMTDKAFKFRTYGSEYLNVQFGWMPFLSDLQSLLKSVLFMSTTLGQLKRDSDRPIRRRFSFETERSVSTQGFASGGTNSPYFGIPRASFVGGVKNPADSTSVQITDTTDREIWFSGSYQYHLPAPKGFWGKLARYEQMANVLLGHRVTPEVLWELAPWSWLIDWWTSIGNVISNATRLSEDGLVLRYGYLMVKTTATRTVYAAPRFIRGTSDAYPPMLATFTRETKQRYRANPYGFGLEWTQLNPQRLAILAALGISQQRR